MEVNNITVPEVKPPRQKKNNYIDNKKFLEALIEYKELVKSAKKKNLPKPRVTEYLGECLLLIAQHLSYQGRFVNYPFRDEMISDGVENCLKVVHNFDEKISKNPFGYFSLITGRAFVRRIVGEKKRLAATFKLIEENLLHHEVSNLKYGDTQTDTSMREFVEKFEESQKKKKIKKIKPETNSVYFVFE